jgi:dTDP-4-dehydrorhamnose 3,5-epimerase-like enzyme
MHTLTSIYNPKGFAHGFVVLSDEAVFAYKCTDFYHPNDEGGLAWDDPDIGIDWPLDGIEEVKLSDKDKVNPTLICTVILPILTISSPGWRGYYATRP